MEEVNKYWQFAKPVIIIVIAVIGYFQEIIFPKDISNVIFLIIITFSLVFRGKAIKDGLVAIIRAIFNK